MGLKREVLSLKFIFVAANFGFDFRGLQRLWRTDRGRDVARVFHLFSCNYLSALMFLIR
jgi:hypothetical protein